VRFCDEVPHKDVLCLYLTTPEPTGSWRHGRTWCAVFTDDVVSGVSNVTNATVRREIRHREWVLSYDENPADNQRTDRHDRYRRQNTVRSSISSKSYPSRLDPVCVVGQYHRTRRRHVDDVTDHVVFRSLTSQTCALIMLEAARNVYLSACVSAGCGRRDSQLTMPQVLSRCMTVLEIQSATRTASTQQHGCKLIVTIYIISSARRETQLLPSQFRPPACLLYS